MATVIKNQTGFSLLELLFAILIAAISITFGLPSLTEALNNQRLKGSARDLFSNFKKAKQEAIRRNSNVVVSITTATYTPDGMVGNYQIFVDDGKGTGTAENFILDGDEEVLATIGMPKNVSLVSSTFTGTPKSTSFNSRGLPTKLGDVRLRNSVRWYRISVSIAGNVKMAISKDNTW